MSERSARCSMQNGLTSVLLPNVQRSGFNNSIFGSGKYCVISPKKLSFAGEGEDPLGEAAGDEGGGGGGVEVEEDHPH